MGDGAARSKLVEDNLRLVWSVARRFQNRGYELDDLYQIGCIGLVKAIDHFDVTRDVKLSTYAVPVMIGEIKRFLRDDGAIKISRSLKKQIVRVKVAKQTIEQQIGREVSMDELAVATELSKEDILVTLCADQSMESLDRPVTNQQGEMAKISDFIADQNSETERLEQKLYVEQLLSNLSNKERQVIKMRYFEYCTQSYIGKVLNMSQVQISRLEKRALSKMREQQ